MKNRRNQQGFTLIELMIVIAIIGILMAYAIPAYRDYTVRAARGECNSIADGLKTPMSEHYYKNGGFPTLLADMSLTESTTDNVSGVTLSAPVAGAGGGASTGGVICALNAPGNGGSVIWQSSYTPGEIAVIWTCTESGNADYVASQAVCP